MRILHVTEASAAGTLQVVRTLARAQGADGHAVTLAYADRPDTPADLARLSDEGVELVPLPWSRRSPRSHLAVARRLRRLARDREPDIAHLHSSFAGAVGALALPRGVTVVYTPHGLASGRTGSSRAVRAAETLVARRARLVGAVSEAEAEAARRLLRARRVAVVRNGIPELDEPPVPAGDRSRPLAVAMGRITAQRRPAATARILAALAPAARVAWLGGAGADEDAPLRDAGIEVTGWLPRAELLDRLAEATVYLHWSEWDGQSLAILEAIARDVVVVASDIPANRDVLGAGPVRADEASAIALARAALDDPAVRAELLAEQRRRAPAFAASRMASEWLNVYDSARAASDERLLRPSSTVPAPKIGGPWT